MNIFYICYVCASFSENTCGAHSVVEIPSLFLFSHGMVLLLLMRSVIAVSSVVVTFCVTCDLLDLKHRWARPESRSRESVVQCSNSLIHIEMLSAQVGRVHTYWRCGHITSNELRWATVSMWPNVKSKQLSSKCTLVRPTSAQPITQNQFRYKLTLDSAKLCGDRASARARTHNLHACSRLNIWCVSLQRMFTLWSFELVIKT